MPSDVHCLVIIRRFLCSSKGAFRILLRWRLTGPPNHAFILLLFQVMKILLAYGIPREIVGLMQRIYADSVACVITEDGLNEALFILAGVMQEDTLHLAPYLFIIVIKWIMRVSLESRNIWFTLHPRRLAGHLARHEELLRHQPLFWKPLQVHHQRGRPYLTYIDILQRDRGLDNSKEINKLMLDRQIWKKSYFCSDVEAFLSQ